MNPSQIEGDVHVMGNLSARTMSIPAGTVDDSDVKAGAGISATKLQHQHQIILADGDAAEPSADTKKIHLVNGATGSIISVKAAATVPATGDGVTTVDLTVNGASVLDAPIELNSTQAADEVVSAVIDTADLAAGDILRVDVAVDAGTGALPTGVSVHVVLREDAQ